MKTPLPLRAIAAAVCILALPVSLPAAASAPAAKAQPAAAAAVRRYELNTNIVDGKMVYVDAKGQVNPTLVAKTGDTVEIVLSSGEGAEHDMVIPQLNVASSKFSNSSGKVTVRFKVTRAGSFVYYCSIPGHRQIGMEGKLEVTGPALAEAPAPAPATDKSDAALALYTPAPSPMRGPDPSAVSVAANPASVPAAIGQRAPQLLKYRMETVELPGKLDDGTSFTYWTFNRQVPGPMLRARVGDTVELTLFNARDSKMIHSIDLHAVTGGHGGGEHTQVAPGQEKTITFKALHPGLYVYHCATPLVPQHIAAGMYGMILVEPEGGLSKVDREYYVMQGEMYTGRPHGAPVHQEPSLEKMSNELPDYYVFNGEVGALSKTHKLQAKVGETVRIYFGVGGPNKISSFHIIGEVFDKVYSEGSLSSIKHDVQTTLVAPGGATIVELKMEHPGSYLLVDHALSRAGKGAVGVLEVTGDAVPGVYHAGAHPAGQSH
ncbi:copper-containing nitrite reductase [Janthinobacterium aquaticum]|uniref:copper-containing nitrite reductase n=1 Tax=Janthinobacterium sp. FT58W TaxID=2654254 RepID=UPI00126476C9|nr:copper-containing nitrite reductase [Janthinobacterium sp. FT58W]KAB8043706.1 nitrite reductase, copper-containing [Janthinobacterium sp. FT58W]